MPSPLVFYASCVPALSAYVYQKDVSLVLADLVDATRLRVTRVVLAAAHLDSDPTNNRLANLRSLCQRCHMLHDRPHHLAQRWITYRRRYALGDLFLGLYKAGGPIVQS